MGMVTMMEAAKEESSEDCQAKSLPVGNNAKVEDEGHQPVPEPHNDRSEKE
jgi:hypothetical protein